MWKNIMLTIMTFAFILLGLINIYITKNARYVPVMQEIICEQQNVIRDLEKNFNIYQAQLPTLKVLQDAGVEIKNIHDLQTLIAEGDKLPYGSPFSGGHRITSRFGHRNELALGGRKEGFHKGIDLLPKTRDKNIYATAEGEIIEFGFDEFLGKYIILETTTGYRLKYGHLRTIYWQDVKTQTVKGIKIQKGSKLGYMGDTGKWTTGAHLHFEIHKKINNKWVLLDPEVVVNYIGLNKQSEYDDNVRLVTRW